MLVEVRRAFWGLFLKNCAMGTPMRGVGIITLLSVGAISAAPSPQPREPSLVVTEKSAADFADCFARHSRGVSASQGAYSITVTDRGSRREILLRGAAPAGLETEAVEQCT